MQSFSIEKSAFKKVTTHRRNLFALAEMQVLNYISSKQNMVYIEHQFAKQFPPLLQYLANILLTLLSSENDQNKGTDMKEQKLTTQEMEGIIRNGEVPITLIKQIFHLIHSKLVHYSEGNKFVEELGQSMLFDKNFFYLFKGCICHKNSTINLDVLASFYNKIREKFSHEKTSENIYFLYGGNQQTISGEDFRQKLKGSVESIGKVFTSTNNFINRNFSLIRKQNSVFRIIEGSIKVICNYQNQFFIENEIKDLSYTIFQEKDFLTKAQFISKVHQFIQHPMLFLYPDLLNVQAALIESPNFKHEVLKRDAVNQTNFYTQEMQKLLKKCPFNGDERCDCKKCNCVRRNRESAKLSQEKKRSAVEQIGPLKQKITQLQKRNKQLEDQNKILKGLMSQLKKNSNMRTFLESAVEPMSKALNDEEL